MKVVEYDDFLKEELKRPAVRKEYDALEEEYNFTTQLIALRHRAGLSQRELAKRVKTSQPCIARLESGRYRKVSLSFLRRVGRVLGVEPHVTFRRLRPSHKSRSVNK
jgi:transcriptional regulator with XRE-family HTH domain